jgi:hypothetical protein
MDGKSLNVHHIAYMVTWEIAQMVATYRIVKIPITLADEVDKLVGKHGFTSRAEVVKEATRALILQYPKDGPE